VPRPRNDPIFKWAYTYIDCDLFQDGRTPEPIVLGYTGLPYPPIVLEAPRPGATPTRSGPWWFCQDLAAGGLLGILWSATYFGLVPVVSTQALADCPQAEVFEMRSINLPASVDDHCASGPRSAMRTLLSARDEHSASAALERLVSACATLTDPQMPGQIRSFRIGLVRFPYRPWREGPATSRFTPLIFKPSRSRRTEQSTGTCRPDVHPARRALQSLSDLVNRTVGGDRCALREFLNSPVGPPPSDWTVRMLGRTFGERGHSDLAYEVWSFGDAKGDAECSYELALALIEQRRADEAIAVAERSDRRGSASGAFLHGELLFEAGELAEAEDAFRRGDERGDGRAAFRLGAILMRRGDPDGAEAAIRRADEWGTPPAATMLGVRLHDRGREDEALAALQRGDDRGDRLAPYILGQMAHEAGKEAEAEAAWRRADERGHAEAAIQLAKLALQRNDVDRAEAALRRAVDRGDRMAVSMLAALFVEHGRETDAIDVLRETPDPSDARAACLLADLLERQGDAGAEDAWRRASELGNETATYRLALILVNRGDVQQALPLLARTVSSSDTAVAAAAALAFGQLHAHVGDLFQLKCRISRL